MQGNNADIRHAVYLTVHEFPARRGMNSVQTAAQVLHRAAGTVYNKADPGNDDQGLLLEEALALMTGAGDYRVLHALAAACDHVAVHMAPMRQCSDSALIDALTLEQAAFGQKARTIHEALLDKRVDSQEISLIREAAYHQVRCTLELLSRLEGMADASRT